MHFRFVHGLLGNSINYLICKCFFFLVSFPGISRATKKAFAIETLADEKKNGGFAFLKKMLVYLHSKIHGGCSSVG